MAIPVRINEELYSLLAEHALADGRSIIKELEIILTWHFSNTIDYSNRIPKTIEKVKTDKDTPAKPSKFIKEAPHKTPAQLADQAIKEETVRRLRASL